MGLVRTSRFAGLYNVPLAIQDEEIRQGVKKFSDWPTYPQLYVQSELLGGCDIVMELSGNGELAKAIEEELQ